MEMVKCNCLTKTPEPKYHKENCPVFQEGFSTWYEKMTALAAELKCPGFFPSVEDYPTDGFKDGLSPQTELDELFECAKADC